MKNPDPKAAAWLETRQSKLKIIGSTKTPLGKVVDWIPLESQTSGNIAPPPPATGPSGPPEQRWKTSPRPPRSCGTRPGGLRADPAPGYLQDYEPGKGFEQGRPPRFGQRHSGLAQPGGIFSCDQRLWTPTFGCSAWLNVWEPKINIPSAPGDDHSISQFWLQYNKAPQLLQSLEAGLTVDNNLNGGLNNHIFSFYTSNGYGGSNPSNNIGGYNQTGGWVQTNSSIFPGIAISNSSVQGGTQIEIGLKFELFQKNWWLGFSNNGAQPWVWLGYYPASLFNGLANGGNWLSFGGEVDTTLANPCNTQDQMGSGRHAADGWTKAAYQRLLINQSNANGSLVNYSGTPEVDVGATTCSKTMYTVQCTMNSGTNWGSYQYYGGLAS